MMEAITNAATSLSQMQLANAVQTSVLDNSLQVTEAKGEAMNELIQSSSVADQEMGRRVNLLV